MRKLTLASALLVLAGPAAPAALAGCANYIFMNDPGYAVQDVVENDSGFDQYQPPGRDSTLTDNQGNVYLVRRGGQMVQGQLLSVPIVFRLSQGVYSRFLTYYLPENPEGAVYILSMEFDAINGVMYLHLSEACVGTVKITGFAPLFDIIQTYTPSATSLQFRVPAHPEGLHSADHFDTYWGHVSDLPDFTQAQPMACGYPADHTPQHGEYLTVPDTSPQPPAGAANYTVTAVTHAGQRRYGRQLIASVLSGRDPALLPSCP